MIPIMQVTKEQADHGNQALYTHGLAFKELHNKLCPAVTGHNICNCEPVYYLVEAGEDYAENMLDYGAIIPLSRQLKCIKAMTETLVDTNLNYTALLEPTRLQLHKKIEFYLCQAKPDSHIKILTDYVMKQLLNITDPAYDFEIIFNKAVNHNFNFIKSADC